MALNTNQIILATILLFMTGATYLAWINLPEIPVTRIDNSIGNLSPTDRISRLDQDLAELREHTQQLEMELKQQNRMQRAVIAFAQNLSSELEKLKEKDIALSENFQTKNSHISKR